MNKELQEVQHLPVSNKELLRKAAIKEELNLMLDKEEIFWMQRAQANWMKEGERNTKFSMLMRHREGRRML